MKKLLSLLAIGLLNFSMFGGIVFAEETSEPKETKVIVTEEIPGMKCEFKPLTGSGCEGQTKEKNTPECRKYECTVKGGFQSVQDMLGGVIKYSTFIVALLGVLMLVYSGIEMSMSGAFGDSKKAKERIEKIVIGLVLLFLVGFILNSVAPWIYQ